MEGTSAEIKEASLNINSSDKKVTPKKSKQASPKKSKQASPKNTKQESQKRPTNEEKQDTPKDSNATKPSEPNPTKPAEEPPKVENPQKIEEPPKQSNSAAEPVVIKDRISKPPIFTVKRKKLETKVIFVYKRDKNEIGIKQDLTFNALMPLLDEKLRLNGKKVELYYKDNLVNIAEKGNSKVLDLIANDSFPFIEVKKIYAENPLKLKNYDYIINIDGIKEMTDLHNQINNFFSTLLLSSDYKIEHFSQSKVQISFTCQEYLFDFFRYLNYLKITNELYSGIKMKKVMNKVKKVPKVENSKTNDKKNINKLRNKSVAKYHSALYINLSTPYKSVDDLRREEYKENKKKWITNKDFVTAVSGKNYSNKFLD